MNIQEYIASGILEEYILGQLSADKRAEVEAMAMQHPAVREELKSIEEALAKYGLSHAKPLPVALKQKILHRITSLETKKEIGKTKSKGNKVTFMWMMALIIALAALIVWLLFGMSKLGREYQRLHQQNDSLVTDCDSVRTKLNQLEEQLTILQSPGLQLVFLAGTEKSKSSQVVVHYNPVSQQTYLRVDALPAPASNKQYQLWAIVEGAPVSMGVFDIPSDTSTMISVPHIPNAQAFAVTLENAGGVPSPTMEEMYVIGNVGG